MVQKAGYPANSVFPGGFWPVSLTGGHGIGKLTDGPGVFRGKSECFWQVEGKGVKGDF